MKKLIAIDLDGTLLNYKNKIPRKTKEYLIQLQKEGNVVMIATGRPYEKSINFAKELKLDKYNGYLSNYNGALLTDVSTGEKISERKLDRNLINKLFKFLDGVDSDYSVLKDGIYYTSDKTRLLFKIFRKYTGKGIVKVDRDFNIEAYKILINGYKKELEKTKSLILEKFREEVEVYRSSIVSIEITPKGISKAESLKIISDKLDIDKKDIIAFGNQGNDIPMIEYAGYGVAMGNSSKALKQKAKYITDTNNRDGIEKWLKNNINRGGNYESNDFS